MKPRCPLAFASLESALESTISPIAPKWQDSVYLLLFELGTNILKYGLCDLYAPTLHTHKTPPAPPPHTLLITTHICDRQRLHLSFCYSVTIKAFCYPKGKPSAYTRPLICLHTSKQPSPLGSTHHHNLGHKLIKRYAEIFCYNAPRFTIISAQYRTISMVIKGQYLAI